jgi:hypothetical protein
MREAFARARSAKRSREEGVTYDSGVGMDDSDEGLEKVGVGVASALVSEEPTVEQIIGDQFWNRLRQEIQQKKCVAINLRETFSDLYLQAHHSRCC